MSKPLEQDVNELIKRLQADQAGVQPVAEPTEETDFSESSPVLTGRLAKAIEAQKAPEIIASNLGSSDESTDYPGAEGVAQIDPNLLNVDEPHFDDGLYPMSDEIQKPAKVGVAAKIREKLAKLTDPLNHESDNDLEAVANWPKQIHIGFMTQVRKKDLIFHIGEWVTDNASSKSSCFYQITPYSGGFAYEIQEGGSGRGVLKTALETLSRHSEVIIPSSERYLQLSIKSPGFSSYLLDESDSRVPSHELEFKDPLKPVFSRHHGLMVSGVLAALLGLAAIGSSWFMVYNVYNKDKVPVYTKTRYELPSDQIRKVNDVVNQPGSYLEKLEYKGDRWNLVVKQSWAEVAPQDQQAQTAVDAALPAAEQALKDIQNSIEVDAK